MLYTSKKNIEDLIIEILSQHPDIEGPVLLDLIEKKRPNTTKQAMYHALAYLLDEEVVVKIKTVYSISNIWKVKIQNNLIKDSSDMQSILGLNEGESISLKFPSLLTADFYWAHIYLGLTDWVTEENSIFVWNTHEWFVIGREDVERDVLQNFVNKSKKAFYSISGKTALDKDFKKKYTSSHLSINTGADDIFPKHVYVNIFQNILVEVFLSKELAKEIDQFYNVHQVPLDKLSQDDKDEFIQIVSKKYPVRIKVSKNTKKTSEIKRKIAKDFVL